MLTKRFSCYFQKLTTAYLFQEKVNSYWTQSINVRPYQV